MSLAVPRMVLIDLDGTLADSVPDLAYCVDAMMRALDLPERGEAAVRLWVGNGVERLVKRALTGAIDGEPDPGDFALALRVFNELYQIQNGILTRLYPGVVTGLESLAKRQMTLGCVTNKSSRFTLPLIEKLGIAHYFKIVVAGDTLPTRKPHPAPLLYAAKELGCQPEEALMVGDSRSDVLAARAAGFPIVCMSYGYNHGEDIRSMAPDAVVDSLVEIDRLLTAGSAGNLL